jgi:nicotinamidase/pyrazinamidase
MSIEATVDSAKLLQATSDALLIVDVQRDFLPGGALGVPEGDQVIPVLNRYVAQAQRTGARVFASRDWHPSTHCSFKEQGGIWPPHCIAQTPGAEFPPELHLPAETQIIDKAVRPELEAYSAFAGTDLADTLRAAGIRRLVVGGLTTDYCVLRTVCDALAEGFEVFVLQHAIRAVDVHPGDGARALDEMRAAGAVLVH